MLITYLESIEAAARGNARVEALDQAYKAAGAANASLLKWFFCAVSNPFITYGLAKLPTKGEATGFYQNDAQWADELCGLASDLQIRKLSGNDARNAVARFLDDCNEPQRKWGERFLLKDLRLNLGSKELQKIWGKDCVPIFDVPLAVDFDKMKQKDWDRNLRYHVQPKLDGGRCVAIIDADGKVELLSRTGKPWPNFASIQTVVQELADKNGLKNVVLDGEVVSLDEGGKINFQQIQKTMHRKDGVEVGYLQFVLFDACSLGEWRLQQETYDSHFTYLSTVIGPMLVGIGGTKSGPAIRIIESRVSYIGGGREGAAYYGQEFVEQGYEGGILRVADEPNRFEHTKAILKVKTFQDAEAVIIGMNNGKGRLAETLGELVCRLPNGIEFECGSGFSDAQRAEFWADQQGFVGQNITFKYFEYTNDGKPRFPIFKGIRHPDDIGAAK